MNDHPLSANSNCSKTGEDIQNSRCSVKEIGDKLTTGVVDTGGQVPVHLNDTDGRIFYIGHGDTGGKILVLWLGYVARLSQWGSWGVSFTYPTTCLRLCQRGEGGDIDSSLVI